MAAQALYLKYRPLTFQEIVGQDPVTRTLRNALRQGTFRHAYLFTGPRGTGKTTTARVLAKAVNCEAPLEERPCNACASCVAVNEGRLMDLIEVDAASNRGIDEIRDIREKVRFRPSQARLKVYVLDEAHMLTSEAFNALLKTLEEPPPHVLFVLVTTVPHKIPATIVSRCQRFDFRRVPMPTIVDRLSRIAQLEGLAVEPAALELIARHGTGAVRDAVSLLDQLTSYGREISLGQVQMVLGTVTSEAAGNVARCLASGDTAAGLDAINSAVTDGADPRQFAREVVEYLRGLLLIKEGAGARLLNVTREQAQEMEGLAGRFSREGLLQAIRLFAEAGTDLKRAFESIPQLPLELALVELTLREPETAPGVQPSAQLAPAPAAVASRQVGAVGIESRPTGGQVAVASGARPADLYQAGPSAPPAEAAMTSGPALSSQATEALSLGQVGEAWKRVLQAMRQRNQTTQAVLASGCRPVAVDRDLVIITVPSHILAEKLRDPQRTLEIEEVMSDVLGARCRLKLVLAADYVSQEPAPSSSTQVAADVPGEADEGRPQTARADDSTLGQIADWAQKHGGQARVVPQ